jgi:DNA primase
VQNPGLTAKLDGEAMFENPLVAELIEVARTATSSQQILEHFIGRPEASMLFEGVFTAPDQTLEIGEEDFAVVQISSRQREDTLRQELAALKAQIPKAAPEQQLILAKQCGDLQRAMEAERRTRMRA